MINKSILVGRTTKDIELVKTQSGASIVKFILACNRKVKTEGQPDADFITCIAWNKTAELMERYVHKGMLIGIEGRIQTGSYDDKDGKRVYTTDVVVESVQFLESNKSNQVNTNTYETQNVVQNEYESDITLDINSNDLPF